MKPTILIIAIIIMSIIPLSVTAQQPQAQPTPTPTATLVYDVNKTGPLTELEQRLLDQTQANYDNYLHWQDVNNGFVAELNYYLGENDFDSYRITAKIYMHESVPMMNVACKEIANRYVSARTDKLRQHNVKFWLTCNRALMHGALLALSSHQSELDKTYHAPIYLNNNVADGLGMIDEVYELAGQ